MAKSPLVLPPCVPVRAKPNAARMPMRFNCREDMGASVAMTTMTDPCEFALDALRHNQAIPARPARRPRAVCAASQNSIARERQRYSVPVHRAEHARRRPDAAFEFIANHARPAADRAFGDDAVRGGINGFKDMRLWSHAARAHRSDSCRSSRRQSAKCPTS